MHSAAPATLSPPPSPPPTPPPPLPAPPPPGAAMTSAASGAGGGAGAGPGAPTRRQTHWVFFLFVATDVLLSVDAGALPVALPEISARFALSRFLQGTVGALSPAGFAAATTAVGVLLTRRSPRLLLIAGLAATAAASATVAGAWSTGALLLARCVYGTAYAVFFVFAPVWISMFAPEDRATSWIGVLQAGAPVGAVFGLVSSGLVASHGVSWRWTFWLQAGGIALCTAAFCFVPSRFVDGEGGGEGGGGGVGGTGGVGGGGGSGVERLAAAESDGGGVRDGAPRKSPVRRRGGVKPGYEGLPAADGAGDDAGGAALPPDVVLTLAVPPVDAAAAAGDAGDGAGDGGGGGDDGSGSGSVAGAAGAAEERRERRAKPSLREQLGQLAANKVFVYSSLALGFLTFTVEGIRYWVVLYRTEVFHENLSVVVASFTLVSSTAPILGMFMGGGIIDRAGGYRSKEGVARSLRILMIFSLCAGPSAAATLLGDIGTKSSMRFFAASVWFLLFFGAAHVAPLTGIMIAVVPPEMRALSSAVSLLVNHVIGYFFAPFGIGILANERGIKLGFQAVISAAAVAISFCFAAWIVAERVAAASRARRPRRRNIHTADEGEQALLPEAELGKL